MRRAVLALVALAGCGTPLAEVSSPGGFDVVTALTCPATSVRLGVANHGTGRLHVSVTFDDGGAPVTLSAPDELALAGTDPTWWSWLNLDVAPTEVGIWTATVHLATDDPEHPAIDVPVRVVVYESAVDVQPTDVAVGDVAVGEAVDAVVKLTNRCPLDDGADGDMEIDTVDVDPTPGPWTPNATPPVLVSGGSAYQFSVIYAPTEPGDDEAVLRITASRPDAAAFEIPLSGHAH